MITGLLACFLLLQYWRTGGMSHRLALWTMIFGLADFAWAYGIGVSSFQTPLQVFAIGEFPATNLFPIALIPFLLAPIAMGYMVMTLIVLQSEDPSKRIATVSVCRGHWKNRLRAAQCSRGND